MDFTSFRPKLISPFLMLKMLPVGMLSMPIAYTCVSLRRLILNTWLALEERMGTGMRL